MSLVSQNGQYIEQNTNGIAVQQVGTGPASQAHNRNVPSVSSTYASSTNSITWASPGITEVSVTPKDIGVLVVYDAPNDATASAWLADAGTTSSDIQYDYVPVGTTLIKNLNSAITRLDMVAMLNGITRVVVGAN